MKDSWFQAWDGSRDCTAEAVFDEDGVQAVSGLNARGQELPDPVPTAPPVGMRQGPSLADYVQTMIRNEVSRRAAAVEMETFEEADDFDVGDEPIDPETPYEEYFDPVVKVSSYDPKYAAAVKAFIEAREAAEKKKQGGGGGDSPPSGEPAVAAVGGVKGGGTPPSEGKLAKSDGAQ